MLRNVSYDFFFFSSRRRHTRLVSDWSSDVCSSDLSSPSTRRTRCCSISYAGYSASSARLSGTGKPVEARRAYSAVCCWRRIGPAYSARSEERRVGKGGRAGGSREQSREKGERLSEW